MQDVSAVLQKQKAFFAAGKTLDLRFRIGALNCLRAGVIRHEAAIMEALHADLGKSPAEAWATEIGLALNEIGHAISHLPRWTRARRAPAPLLNFPCACRVEQEPYGAVLILSPWNYPFQLALVPLIGAIAAGNTAVVKPSAYAPTTSRAIAGLLGDCFGEEHVAVFEGGREANAALLAQRFDYIFFTGSQAVGRTVMEAAAAHLTPVTLELGGKSPCVVCQDADIETAARRILWGKTINAGQTCVAPDYVLAHEGILLPLVEAMKRNIGRFWGPDPTGNPEYPRIVNEKHFRRLMAYLDSGTVFAGGRCDEKSLRIEPTILLDVPPGAPVMREEIFGPVLPVLPFRDLGDAVAFVSGRPKPLAFYLFTADGRTERVVLGRVSFGGGCVNDTVMHFTASGLPFGGVGESGMGGYHGKWSFETFSHRKAVMKKSTLVDIALRYPPYGNKLGLFKKVLK